MPRNPFNVPDIVDPDSVDVNQLLVALDFRPGDSIDENTIGWSNLVVDTSAESIDGQWESRWRFSGQAWSPTYYAEVKSVNSFVYIYYEDHQGRFLVELERKRDWLVGCVAGIDNPRDKNPCVIRIVDTSRLDGVWGNRGRLDFRRRIKLTDKNETWHDINQDTILHAQCQRIISYQEQAISSLRISRKGDKIAYATCEGTVEVCDIYGEKSQSKIEGLPKILDLTWSFNGNYIAVLSEDGGIYIYNVFEGSHKQIGIQDNPSPTITWTQNMDLLATSSKEGSICIWNCENFIPARELRLKKPIEELMWRPNGYQLLIRHEQGSLSLLERPDRREIFEVTNTENEKICSISWTVSGVWIATINENNTVNVFSTVNGKTIAEFTEINKYAVSPNDFNTVRLVSRDDLGPMIAVGTSHSLSLWGIEKKKKLIQLKSIAAVERNLSPSINRLDAHQDGELIAIASDKSNEIRIWSLSHLLWNSPTAVTYSSKRRQGRLNKTDDVFICHASEDKPLIVGPLYERLRDQGISIWIDKDKLVIGDRIYRIIQDALQNAQYVVVVLSKNFVSKSFPNEELEACFAIEKITKQLKVIPVLVGTPQEVQEILQEYPFIASRFYAEWSEGIDVVVDKIKRKVIG